jgi:TonB family protein
VVILEVLFAATGEVRILRLLQGLGYGLDENAVRAARQIRFRPAERQGEVVDSVATVQIRFQLAY